MAVAELGLTVAAPERARVERRVAIVIAAQLVITGVGAAASRHHVTASGSVVAVAAVAVAFAIAGLFEMPLELHRHRFTITLSEAVLAVAFFVVGPIGLAIAAAAGEMADGLVHRMPRLKLAFNVGNRLAAAMVAGLAFAALGATDAHQVGAWGAALLAAVCFSFVDVVSTATVVSIAEHTRFHAVFVRSAAAGILATLASAPIGLVALDLAGHGRFVPLLLVPLALAVAFNARYAIAQRDEHLRFERLYEASARTAGLVTLRDAVAAIAAEARTLATAPAALCAAEGVDGTWVGVLTNDDGSLVLDNDSVGAARQFASGHPDRDADAGVAPALASLHSGASSMFGALAQHEQAGEIVIVVFRDTATSSAAVRSRAETLRAFANHAALIVANARLHEERAAALAREVDLNRQKSDFVAAVSHELRTPLAVMLGSVHTLDRLDGRMTDEQRAHLFDMTIDQGGRLQRLIDELLLVAAAEHSAVTVDAVPVRAADVLAGVAESTAPRAGARLTLHADPEIAMVTDRSKVERILVNLVENATKYAPDGPLTLVATEGGNEVRFSVVDHGPGIPASDRERVFEQFVQLDQSSTRREGGTGLGLHLCRQLAQLVDGELTLSETAGGGCTFTLALPATDARADQRGSEAAPTSSSGVRARPANVGGPDATGREIRQAAR